MIYSDTKTEAAVIADLAERKASFVKAEDRFLLHSDTLSVVDLDKFLDGRKRKKGVFKTSDRDSFTNFVNLESYNGSTAIFIDESAMSAKAIMNYNHDTFEQGHLDFTACLSARKTVTFRKLKDMNYEGRIAQKAFAEFLEDWGHKVIAMDSSKNVIENSKAVNAIRNMSIQEESTAESQMGNHRESRSRFEQVEARTIGGTLPAYFEVVDACYEGMPERKLRLRFTISTLESKPEFKIEITGVQQVEEELAKEFASIVEEGFEGKKPVFIGSFSG